MESLGICPLSSIGQSVCLRSKRLGIRIPQGALKDRLKAGLFLCFLRLFRISLPKGEFTLRSLIPDH